MNKKILLIDDDQDEQLIFSEVLKEIGKPVTFEFALSVAEGLKKIKEIKPDFVFLDVNMPVVNGFKCLEIIKRDSKLKDIPVIIYSTGINDVVCNKAKQIGADGCIQKRTSVHELSSLLKDYIA